MAITIGLFCYATSRTALRAFDSLKGEVMSHRLRHDAAAIFLIDGDRAVRQKDRYSLKQGDEMTIEEAHKRMRIIIEYHMTGDDTNLFEE